MTSNKQPNLSWDISVPLVNNPFIFRTSVQLCLITWLVIMVLFGFIFAATGEYDAVLPLLGIMTLVCAGLWVLLILVMLVFFGNRMPMRFTIHQDGVTCDLMSRRSKRANRLLIVLGVLARKPGAVGAGAIAVSQESQTVEWERIYAVTCNEKRKVLTLRNRWRSLLMVFCQPENYGRVVETIKECVPHRPGSRKRLQNPVFGLLLRTALTVLACVPLFQLDYPFKIDLFVPIFTLCFAVATIWLIPLFGYVVIGAVFYMTVVIISQALKVHTSQYRFLGSYRGYEMIHGSEWIFMALLGAATVYLIWSSWRSIKGKNESALFLD